MELIRIKQGDSVCNSHYVNCASTVKTKKIGNMLVKEHYVAFA